MLPSALRRAGAVPALALSFAAVVDAQCGLDWLSTGPSTGPNAVVRASAIRDPDGPGPLPPTLVLAGDFTVAGDAISARIAAYEPVTRTWAGFGAGLDGAVRALAVLPNGDLVAGGAFTAAGGQPANRVARWNGTTWSPLGLGFDADVLALAVLPNGDLVAGGSFSMADGAPASRVARWNGIAWSPLGAGVSALWTASGVEALHVLPSGDLVVGGRFTQAGAIAAENVARWDGTSWSPLGAGVGTFVFGEDVAALTTLPTGELVAGGTFTTAGGQPAVGVATWDGVGWTQVGPGLQSTISSLALLPTGELLVGGAHHLVAFDGVGWIQVGNGSGIVSTIAPLANGTIVVGGSFPVGAGQMPRYAQRFDGLAWNDLTNGLDGQVGDLVALPSGDVLVGGHFTAEGIGANGVARWDGSSWTPLGAGLVGGVWALATLPNGDVVAGGAFSSSGGLPANRIARWDGTSWTSLGGGCNGLVRDLLVTRSGDVVATGAFTTVAGQPMNRIARWNGSSWSPLGSGLTGTFVLMAGNALAELPNGDLIVGGSFAFAGGVATAGVARWDGSQWWPLGTGIGAVEALAVLPDGDLVAGGAFSQAGGVAASCIARWNGSTWAPLGAGTDNTVTGLLVLPDGDLLATGLFQTAGGVPARRIARWDGAAWSAVGDGLGGAGGGYGTSLAWLANGDVAVGGSFLSAGDLGSAYFALLRSACPATVTSFGTGCVGVGGPNTLAASSQPWIGATCTVVASGMPSVGLAIGVRGLGTASLPLASILPQGAPGCTLLVTPDLLELHLPVAGLASETFAVPDSVALVGQMLHEQFVGIELDPQGAITSLTSSNALALTIGAF